MGVYAGAGASGGVPIYFLLTRCKTIWLAFKTTIFHQPIDISLLLIRKVPEKKYF